MEKIERPDTLDRSKWNPVYKIHIKNNTKPSVVVRRYGDTEIVSRAIYRENNRKIALMKNPEICYRESKNRMVIGNKRRTRFKFQSHRCHAIFPRLHDISPISSLLSNSQIPGPPLITAAMLRRRTFKLAAGQSETVKRFDEFNSVAANRINGRNYEFSRNISTGRRDRGE